MPEPRKFNPAWAGIILTLLLQLIAFVWGAARLSGAVDQLNTTTQTLSGTVGKLEATVNRLDTRVTVLEDRQAR